MASKHLGVAGSPISHSLSPKIHSAAYRHLGLDWSYSAFDVLEADFIGFLRQHIGVLHGLSVTMPLKETAFRVADEVDAIANATKSVNTLSFSGGSIRGFNTDVFGIIASLEKFLVETPATVAILGNGATARSMLLALRSIAPSADYTIFGRSLDRVSNLATSQLAKPLSPKVNHLNAFNGSFDLTINTMPTGAVDAMRIAVARGQLFEVGYRSASSFSANWADKSRIDGLEMLIWQALAQIRVFVNGSPGLVLENEAKLIKIMRKAVQG